MSCWIAEQNFIYVRPCLSLLDFVFAIVFAAVVGSIVGGLAWTLNPIRNDKKPAAPDVKVVLINLATKAQSYRASFQRKITLCLF